MPDTPTVPADSASFELVVELVGDVTVLVVRGELGLATAPRLDAEATMVIEQPQRAVVVDLREASFADTVAVAVLLRVAHAQAQLDRRLLIVCDGPAQRVFATAGVADRLELHRSRGAALAALGVDA